MNKIFRENKNINKYILNKLIELEAEKDYCTKVQEVQITTKIKSINIFHSEIDLNSLCAGFSNTDDPNEYVEHINKGIVMCEQMLDFFELNNIAIERIENNIGIPTMYILKKDSDTIYVNCYYVQTDRTESNDSIMIDFNSYYKM